MEYLRKSKMPYNRQITLNNNEYLKQYANNLVQDKEKQIKIAQKLMSIDVVNSLRGELEEIRQKCSQILEDNQIQVNDSSNIIPENENELNNILFQAVADSFTTVINEEDIPVFQVTPIDDNTIRVSYDSSKGGYEEDPFVFQNVDQFLKPILLDIVGKIGFGEKNPEQVKQELVDKLKELLETYKDSLITEDSPDTEKGKRSLIYKRTENSLEVASQIYDILKSYGLAGPIAEKQYEELSIEDNAQDQIGEPVMEAKRKIFNLKKTADKVYDSIREKPIQQSDEQYRSVHGKHALPWYEDAYITEEEFKKHIMDKYYPEQLNSDGEYRGGYINDRFVVHHNTEGNSMHIKPGEKNAPDRVESYSTERRLEEMRKNDLRGHEQSEGSKTEQQTKEVTASNISISEENGLYKLKHGSKIIYLDTMSQVDAVKNICSELEIENKKKINKQSQLSPNNTTPSQNNTGVSTLDVESENASSVDNPLLSIVNNLRQQYPNYPIANIIQQGIVELTSSGMGTDEIERFRIETLKALGINTQRKDYGNIAVDKETQRNELEGLMED